MSVYPEQLCTLDTSCVYTMYSCTVIATVSELVSGEYLVKRVTTQLIFTRTGRLGLSGCLVTVGSKVEWLNPLYYTTGVINR